MSDSPAPLDELRDDPLHREAADVFLIACDLPAADRGPFLEQRCSGRSELRARVEALLRQDARTDSFLARDPADTDPSRLEELLPDPPVLAIPRLIGTYRVLGVLGEGGMGRVYRAEQEHPRRYVALKVIHSPFISETLRKRLDNEAAVLGRLKHPGIAQIYEAGIAPVKGLQQPFLAMELVEGATLLEYARGRSIRDRVALFVKVCEAVHHAHQKGIIHRDLKPGNILVDASGQPKVLDFGIAKVTGSDALSVTRHTLPGELIGTVAYMSPEQAEGDSVDLDIRSDVYSLGVVLYRLLSGSPPYSIEGGSWTEALRLIREVDPAPLGDQDRALRGDLENVVARALAKDRELRYPSAHELGADLRRFLADQPVLARRPSRSYVLGKFILRHRVLALTGSVALLSLVLGLAATTFFWTRARAERDRALSLADLRRHEELVQEALTLWPRRPALVEKMLDWIARAEALAARRTVLGRYLDQLRDRDAAGYDNRWLRDNLVQLTGQLATLIDPDPAIGLIADMKQRLEMAQTIRKRTVDDFAQEWSLAADEVFASPLYDGLDLEAHIGLVPLGADPDSGLWEFWLWETGEIPERDEDTGHWRIEEETGMVLVLVPGGPFRMGATRAMGAHHHDPLAQDREGPVHEVTLPPFFISRYEMTQGQWLRLTGLNPSFHSPDSESLPPGASCSLAHPVENINRYDGETTLARLGLDLPTEAQWEYAARAGTESPWSTGVTKETLFGFANLADRALQEQAPGRIEPWDDGYQMTAPVGTYGANGFGLHDVHGNVVEWCAGPFQAYGQTGGETAPGNTLGVVRGGSFILPAVMCRSACRQTPRPDDRQVDFGVRPVLALDR